MIRRSNHTALAAVAILLLASSASALEPDTSLSARQSVALGAVAKRLVSMRAYSTGTRQDCAIIGDDAYALVAALELDHRGLTGGMTPAAAAPEAKYLAQQILRLVGDSNGQCQFYGGAGAPGVYQAAAAVAHGLHRYGAAWPADVKDAIAAMAQNATWFAPTYLANTGVDIVAMQLLVGDALGISALGATGQTNLDAIFANTEASGGIELNAPLYTAEHFPALVFLQDLPAGPAHDAARILLEYELLVAAHLYLPGGGLGAPQSRDYSGGADDGGGQSLVPAIQLLIGDPDSKADLAGAYSHVGALAASDYVLPEVIRSVFLDKGPGYEAWMNTPVQQGTSRTPNAFYVFEQGGPPLSPWQAVMLPSGHAATGLSYGFRLTPLAVSSGTYARAPDGSFAILYQYEPQVCGTTPATNDTDDTGAPLNTSCGAASANGDPDDFTSELYDFERMTYGRTVVTLWDPTTQNKAPNVVRVTQDTRVHLPNYDKLGGAATRAGAWRVGQLGDAYVAYMPLGTVADEDATRGGGTWTYLRLPGPSGGIVELATTDEFPTLADYASDLATRTVVFTPSPLAAEVDARDPATQQTVRVRLELNPEKRFVGGVAQPTSTLSHGLLSSPWVSWDDQSSVLHLVRDCYAPITYDWKQRTITQGAPPPSCSPDDGGPGDAADAGAPGAEPPSEPVAGGCGCELGHPASRGLVFAPLAWLALVARRRRSITPRSPR